MTLSIFNFGKSTGDFQMIAMFRQQYENRSAEVLLQFYIKL